MSKLLIELQYFGTISWYLSLLRHNEIIIESHENFEKSTYRNRCYIASPEGQLRLTIPLKQGRSQRSKYSEVKINNESNWQKNHWNSLCSCYRNSPYFEFYEDRVKPLFYQEVELLFDLNNRIFLLMIELLDLKLKIGYSTLYDKSPESGIEDLRSKILPNQIFSGANHFPVKYHQVFQERTGFIPDLGILDLLFNEGPHSKDLLLSAIKD